MLFQRSIYYMPKGTQQDHWEDHWSERDLQRSLDSGTRKAWWPLLCQLTAPLGHNDLILEAGCGLGQFVYLLARQGKRVVGVDNAEQTVLRVRQALPQLDLRIGDVAQLDMPDDSVALYLSLGVVEHNPQGPDAILGEAARVVKEGGTLFIAVPYHNHYRRIREPWWRMKYRLRRSGALQRLAGWSELDFYQYAFGISEFTSILRRHGFAPRQLLLHHSHNALRKDLGTWWLPRRGSRRTSTRKLDGKRIRKWAARLDRVSPRLMSHMMLVVATRTSASRAA